MTWTRDEALQEELVDPTVPYGYYWCAFCEEEWERNEDKPDYLTCPRCKIGPMEAL